MFRQTYYFGNDVTYHEVPSIYPYIESYFEISNPKQKTIMTIPDCCYELHFFYDENLTYIAGTSLRGRELKIPITSRCFGIRFQPMVAPMYFKHALHEIIDSNYEITHLHPFDTILRSLHAAATFEERIDRFNQSFFYNTSDYQMHPLINHMIQKIQKKNFDIKVIDMIKDSGYSQRQIQRIFKDNTGISIKFFLNVSRIQQAIYLLKYGNIHTITDLAGALGFYDQAHFNHIFKEFTCRNPSAFLSTTPITQDNCNC